MSTYTQIKRDIATYISNNVGGIPVYLSYQNAPLAQKPYITVNITAYTKVGTELQLDTDGAGDQPRSYNEDISVSIQSYGEDSENYLQMLKDSFSTEAGRLELENLNLVIRDDITGIRDIAILVDNTMEPRFLYEVIIGTNQEIVDPVGYINTVEVSGETDGALTSPIEQDFSITGG